jgi:hypothetical protein
MTGLAEAILLLAKSKAAKPAVRESAFVFLALRLTLGLVAELMIDLAIFMALFVSFRNLAGRKGRIYYTLVGFYYTLVSC